MLQLLPLALLLPTVLQITTTLPLHDNNSTTTTHKDHLTSYELMEASNTVTPSTDSPSTATPSPTATNADYAAAEEEAILNELDEALTKLANVYMQALFSGTHTVAMELELNELELKFSDLLDLLYKQERLPEYMKYEAEVTHQLIVYNLLKKLFGYAKE